MRSRYRERLGIFPSVSAPNGESAGIVSAMSDSTWGNNPGTRLSATSLILDEITPEHVVPRPYHNCSHTQVRAASLQGMRTFTAYPWWDPRPQDCTYNVSWPVMVSDVQYQPASVPWNSMVDELASLAEGTTSNSAMLPVTLLEGAKTIAMMRNPFNLLKPNFRRQVRKLTARTLASKVSSIWLEGYYGWKSFYQDTETIAKATAHFLNDDHQRYLEKLGERLSVNHTDALFRDAVYCVGTPETDWNAHYPPPTSYCDNPPFGSVRARCVSVNSRTTAVLGCKQYQSTRQRMNSTRRFLQLYGLVPNWRTVRDTLWEVIPFSFVIDWFVDTRGLWAPLNKWRLGQMDIKDIGFSTHVVSEFDVEVDFSANPFYHKTGSAYQGLVPNYSVPILRSSGRGRISTYNRYSGFPSEPGAMVSFNTKGLSFIRSVNGIALIAQLLSKKA